MPGAEWQTLGELTLSNRSDDHERIRSWLTELLHPLTLYAEFLNKIAISAEEAAARALQPGRKPEHIHLRILVSRDRISTGQSWGFFLVEKIENPSDAGSSASHSVEFYLYTEGQQA
jgi:hypothetical protein